MYNYHNDICDESIKKNILFALYIDYWRSNTGLRRETCYNLSIVGSVFEKKYWNGNCKYDRGEKGDGLINQK